MSVSKLPFEAQINRLRRLLMPVVAGLCLLALSGLASAEAMVTLVLSGRGAAYSEVVDAFQQSYGAGRTVRVAYVDMLGGEELQALIRGSSLVVPVGLNAARQVAANHAGSTAVLSLLVPRSGFESVAWPAGLGKRRLSAIYIDQPAERSFALIANVLPNTKRVGVLLSEGQPAQLAELQREAARLGQRVVARDIAGASMIAPALRAVLPEVDAMLLQPDAMVINANNVQNVLLTTYRFRVPVIGFSEGLVKAGAVAAVYSTTSQIGRQGGMLAVQWSRSGELPAPMYCKEFSVAFNAHVARSLGISLPDEAAVIGRIGGTP